MGKDVNHDMFPITIGVCKVKRRFSWTWFLELLLEDIRIKDQRAWTWMSNQQKVTFEKIESLYCVSIPFILCRACESH